MRLVEIKKPKGKEKKAQQYKPLINKGWKYEGYYINKEYYERATKDNQEKWYKLK